MHQHEILGFRSGWLGPVEGLTMPLTLDSVEEILNRGGTILGSSRTNPYKVDDGIARLKATLDEHRVDALIAIGGEDTLGVAQQLTHDGVPVVGVPKTIDNDLDATDYTFGFDTAVHIATDAIDRLRTTAESHHRALVVEVMGRHAGWIALHAGLAGGANVILVPEQPFSVERVCDWVQQRFERQYAPIIVVAEGALPEGGKELLLTARRTHSATSGWAASVLGWPTRSPGAPARSRARSCSATSSAAARRRPMTGCWPPVSACTRSTRSPRATSARWSRCAARTSCGSRCARRPRR